MNCNQKNSAKMTMTAGGITITVCGKDFDDVSTKMIVEAWKNNLDNAYSSISEKVIKSASMGIKAMKEILDEISEFTAEKGSYRQLSEVIILNYIAMKTYISLNNVVSSDKKKRHVDILLHNLYKTMVPSLNSKGPSYKERIRIDLMEYCRSLLSNNDHRNISSISKFMGKKKMINDFTKNVINKLEDETLASKIKEDFNVFLTKGEEYYEGTYLNNYVFDWLKAE